MKRLIYLLLAASVAVTGCVNEGKEKNGTKEKEPANHVGVKDAGIKFKEHVIILPSEIEYYEAVGLLEDGTLLVAGTGGIYESKDKGKTWEQSRIQISGLDEEDELSYVNALAFGKDGRIFYEYISYQNEEDNDFERKFLLVDAEGNEKELDIDLPEPETGSEKKETLIFGEAGEYLDDAEDEAEFDESQDNDDPDDGEAEEPGDHYETMGDRDNSLFKAVFMPDGNIAATNHLGDMYYIDLKSGEVMLIAESADDTGFFDIFAALDEKIVIKNDKEIGIYDVKSGNKTSAQSLNDFVKGYEEQGEGDFMLTADPDNEILYFSNEFGIYSYYLKGEDEVKTLFEAESNMLSNTEFFFENIFVSEENEIFIFCDSPEGELQLLHYTE